MQISKQLIIIKDIVDIKNQYVCKSIVFIVCITYVLHMYYNKKQDYSKSAEVKLERTFARLWPCWCSKAGFELISKGNQQCPQLSIWVENREGVCEVLALNDDGHCFCAPQGIPVSKVWVTRRDYVPLQQAAPWETVNVVYAVLLNRTSLSHSFFFFFLETGATLLFSWIYC